MLVFLTKQRTCLLRQIRTIIIVEETCCTHSFSCHRIFIWIFVRECLILSQFHKKCISFKLFNIFVWYAKCNRIFFNYFLYELCFYAKRLLFWDIWCTCVIDSLLPMLLWTHGLQLFFSCVAFSFSSRWIDIPFVCL